MKPFINSKLILIITLSWVLAACLGNNSGSSKTGSVANGLNPTNHLSSNLNSTESPIIVQNFYNYIANSSIPGSGATGGGFYQNGMPLAINPLTGPYNKGADGYYPTSPVVAGNYLFMNSSKTITYGNLNYLTEGNDSITNAPAWNSIQISSIQTSDGQALYKIKSPIVTDNNGNLYLVAIDKDNAAYLVTAQSTAPHDWEVINDQYLDDVPENTAPLTVYKTAANYTYVYTATKSSEADGTMISVYSQNAIGIVAKFPLNLDVLALTVSGNIMYVELSDGSLYEANVADEPLSLTFTPIDNPNSGDKKFDLCSVDKDLNWSGPTPLQSSLMAAAPSAKSFNYGGVYLCGSSGAYIVTDNNDSSWGVNYVPLPGFNKAYGITSVGGDLYANTGNNIYSIPYSTISSATDSSSWISSITGNNNLPMSVGSYWVLSVGGDANGHVYGLFKQMLGGNSYGYVMVNDSPFDQWVSQYANFSIPTNSNNVMIAYSASSSILTNNHGLLIITDGTSWWYYEPSENSKYMSFVEQTSPTPINYPAGDINDSISSMAENYKYIYLVTTNGYILTHSINLNGSSTPWVVVYDPTSAYPYMDQVSSMPSAGKASKLSVTADSDLAYFMTTDSSGIGHAFLTGDPLSDSMTQQITPYSGANLIEVADVGIFNTSTSSLGFNYSSLGILGTDGSIWQTTDGITLNSLAEVYPGSQAPEPGISYQFIDSCAPVVFGDTSNFSAHNEKMKPGVFFAANEVVGKFSDTKLVGVEYPSIYLSTTPSITYNSLTTIGYAEEYFSGGYENGRFDGTRIVIFTVGDSVWIVDIRALGAYFNMNPSAMDNLEAANYVVSLLGGYGYPIPSQAVISSGSIAAYMPGHINPNYMGASIYSSSFLNNIINFNYGAMIQQAQLGGAPGIPGSVQCEVGNEATQ